MMLYFTLYLLPGLVWAGYLEYYTTHHLEGEYAKDWSIPERLFHLVFWPLSVSIFIIAFIKEILDRD